MATIDKSFSAPWIAVVVVLGAVSLLAAGGWWWNRSATETPAPKEVAPPRTKIVGTAVKHAPRPEGYVGSQACAKCHADLVASYAGHPMCRSAGRTPGENDVEDFAHGTEFTADGGLTYRVVKEDDGIYHHEMLRDKQGELVYDDSAKIAFFIGSGARGKSYAIDRDGLLFQSPISWFTKDQKWDLSPGYAHRHIRFSRRFLDQCILCHAGRPTSDPQRENYFPEPVLLEAAIGCERCHGPGERHIELRESAEADVSDDPIVNPAAFDATRREAVCYQCHLIGKVRFTRYGRGFEDFRPGDRLDEVWATFVADTTVRGDRKTKSVSHVEQTRDSACFRMSEGRFGCTSCHDPHTPPPHEGADAYYRQKCLNCHAERGCSLPLEQQAAPPASNSCIHCHMPRLSAHDVPHASQTDHRILRSVDDDDVQFGPEGTEVMLFEEENSKLPDWERERALALAQARRLEETGYAGPQEAERLEQTLLDIIEIAPDDVASWDALGTSRQLRSDMEGAHAAWSKALELKPGSEHVLDQLVMVRQKMGDREGTLECLDRLIELNPWRSRDHMRRAMMLSELGRIGEAIADVEKALELDPTDRQARRWLIDAAKRAGDVDRGRRHAEILRRISD